MPTVYNPVIPQPTNNLSNSQGDMLVNFTQADTQFGFDHLGFNVSGSNGSGKHKQVTLPDRTATPPTPGASECAIFGVTNTAVTVPYLVRDGIAAASLQYSLLPIRAFITFNSAGVASGSPMNATSVRNSIGDFTVTLTAKAVTNANFSVFLSFVNSGLNYFFLPYTTSYNVGTQVATINILANAIKSSPFGFQGLQDPTATSCVVMQL